ncbi:SRPBCC family protein [Streptomyces sp. NPDC001928]|uniref:SRPBCC family protein n=1 Tax=Streptomyces sp. NPDC001928 TaxID=3154404 RepID=UPI003332EC4C
MARTTVAVERRIAAGQGTVWESLTDLRGMVHVLSGVTGVEVLTDGAFGVGTRWRETRRMFGKEATEEMWVTLCEPPERYVAEARSHGSHYISEWLVRADGPSDTTVRMTFTGVTSGAVAGVLAKLLGSIGNRAVSKAIAKDLEDIATAVESRAR